MLLDEPPSWGQRGRPQPIDEAEDFPKQLSRHRNLGQLERDVPSMADHFRTDFDQLFPQRGQRPMLDLFGVIQCLLLATSGHGAARNRGLLYPQHRTFPVGSS